MSFIRCLGQNDTLKAQYKVYSDIRLYIQKNCNYPKYAIENEISGKLFFTFRINRYGCIDSIIFKEKPDTSLSNEIRRVLLTTNCKWEPAKVKGKPIDSWYNSDFIFLIQ